MAANVILAVAIIVLALVGAALQDRKKEALQPDTWPAWERKTSYWPFGAIVSGKARLGGFGTHAVAGGLAVAFVDRPEVVELDGHPGGSAAGIALAVRDRRAGAFERLGLARRVGRRIPCRP